MRKSLLMTSSLLVVMLSSGVGAEELSSGREYSGELVISGNQEYSKSNLPQGTPDYDEENEMEAINYEKIEISGGSLELDNFKVRSGNNANISGGEVYLKRGHIKAHEGEMNISGGDITIENDSEVVGDVLTLSGNAKVKVDASCFGGDSNLNISGGTINVTNGGVLGVFNDEEEGEIGAINITGGDVSLEDSYLVSNGNLVIDGGSVVADNSEVHTFGVEISGGDVVLGNDVDFTNDDINESFLLSGGKITMTGSVSVIGTNHGEGNDVTSGKFVMTGGTLEVRGSGTNYIEGGDINISGGEVNIAKQSTLQTIATLTEDDEIGEKSTINLKDEGVINLSGKLVSNVNGNGNLNVKSSGAVVDGSVEGINLGIEADSKLSSLFIGNTGTTDLSSLGVKEGIFEVDSELSVINTINVGENGGLKVTDTNITTGEKETKTDDIVIKGTLTAVNSVIEAGNDMDELDNNSNIVLDGATVTLTNSDLEANGDITIKDASLTSKSSVAEDSLTTGIWADGKIDIEGGKVELDKSYLSANGDIVINGGTHSLTDSGVVSEYGKLDVEGAKITVSEDTSLNYLGINVNKGANLKDTDLLFYSDEYALVNSSLETLGNIVLDGSDVSLENSYMYTSDGNITISGGDIDITNSYIDAKSGFDIEKANIVVVGGKENRGDVGLFSRGQNADINIKKDSVIDIDSGIISKYSDYVQEVGGMSGDINIDGGDVVLKNGSMLEMDVVNIGNLNLKSGSVELSGNSVIELNNNDAVFNIYDGKYKATDSKAFAKGGIVIGGGEVDNNNASFETDKSFTINNGDVKFENSSELIALDGININGGKVDFDNSSLNSNGFMSVSGGEVASNKSDMHAEGIEISGGEIVLKDNVDFTNDDINKSFLLSGGKIVMEGKVSVIGTNHGVGNDVTSGKFVMTGGTLEVRGSGTNYIEGGDINISGGNIDIATQSRLQTIATLTENDGIGDKSTIKLNNKGVINLSGKLVSDVTGDDRGVINFNSPNADIEGNVEDVSLFFNNNYALSDAISGEIGGLNVLGINKGKFSFDKEPTGTITSVLVGEGATLDIGDKILHSTGDKDSNEGVRFSDNSTLKFTVTSKDKYGQIKANYVNISDKGTTLDMALNNAALKQGDGNLTIRLFDQSEDKKGVEIDGQFANLPYINARYDFVQNLDENGKFDGSYDVIAKANSSASDVVSEAGGTKNNEGTAEAWDNLDTGGVDNTTVVEIADKLAELSNKAVDDKGRQEYVDALTALAPDTAPSVQQTATETVNQVFGVVGSRLSGGSIASGGKSASIGGRGHSISGGHRGGKGSRGGHGYRGNRGYRGGHGYRGKSSGDSAFETGAMWVQGMYNKAELEDTSKSKGFDSKTSGLAFGFEKNTTNNTKVGIGYAYNQTDIDGFMRTTDVDTHTAILYGEYKPSQWYINSVATYSWSGYEENKNVSGVNVGAEYDAQTFGLQTMTGYEMNFNGFGFTPETGLRYVHINQDSYKDSAGQKISASSSDILTAVLGIRLNKTFEAYANTYIIPEIRLAATYDVSNDDATSVVTLANGSAYSIKGEGMDEFGLELGASVTSEVNDEIELSVGYEGKFKKNYKDHTGMLNVKYKF